MDNCPPTSNIWALTKRPLSCFHRSFTCIRIAQMMVSNVNIANQISKARRFKNKQTKKIRKQSAKPQTNEKKKIKPEQFQ